MNRQSYSDIEHIFIDGASTDSTVSLIKKFSTRDFVCISENDSGIFDAMNKGFAYASGDIIYFLNSDDRLVDEYVIDNVVTLFCSFDVDFVYGHIRMIEGSKLKRSWIVSDKVNPGITFAQLPHPGLFLKKSVLLGIAPPFDPKYKISADLKQQLVLIASGRFHGLRCDRYIADMALGGASTNSWRSYLEGWIESMRAYNEVFGFGGFFFVALKVIKKIKQVRVFK